MYMDDLACRYGFISNDNESKQNDTTQWALEFSVNSGNAPFTMPRTRISRRSTGDVNILSKLSILPLVINLRNALIGLLQLGTQGQGYTQYLMLGCSSKTAQTGRHNVSETEPLRALPNTPSTSRTIVLSS
ncbi:hypothetical protein ASPWEDRAFT_42831 [Aspergillus wentii DTO 134E9]|uniref:Uncharacterized protein n=1 Tax=Aspergillus wentii DTO 134E9 TaxID=1073089 RepID=A0A1L9RD13_ASPWE|nr:uncharacterized protein ASPWEDRAFT_42831 [Aspergillus wentii DTO 134E9]OJJ32801.1 hypothetical protein ASPWEDRAFT_42831 [Aspergillus wentii DTO 134E9]